MSAVSARSIRRNAETAWTRSEPCNGRSTAVPSKNPNAGSMPCMAMSTAWTSCGGRGPACARTEGAPGVDGVTCRRGGGLGGGAFLQDLAAAAADETYRPSVLRRVQIPKAGAAGGVPAASVSPPWRTGW